MIISLGTKNPAKIQAVEKIIQMYDTHPIEILAFPVSSGVSEQPKSLKETIDGARNRARLAFESAVGKATLGFGIESGLMEAPYTYTGYLDFTACVIYDGEHYYMGLSSMFEFPKQVVEDILTKGIDSSTSFFNHKMTDQSDIGSKEGIVGVLTNRILTRQAYTEHAIIHAVAQWKNKKLYF